MRLAISDIGEKGSLFWLETGVPEGKKGFRWAAIKLFHIPYNTTAHEN